MSRVSMRATTCGGFNHVAFVREHFDDAAGELGVDIDLVRLYPAVARHDPERKAALPHMPPIGGASAGADDDDPQQRQRLPPRSAACRGDARRRGEQRGTRGYDRVIGARQNVAMSDLDVMRWARWSRSIGVVGAHVRLPVGGSVSAATIIVWLLRRQSRRTALQSSGSFNCDEERLSRLSRRTRDGPAASYPAMGAKDKGRNLLR